MLLPCAQQGGKASHAPLPWHLRQEAEEAGRAMGRREVCVNVWQRVQRVQLQQMVTEDVSAGESIAKEDPPNVHHALQV